MKILVVLRALQDPAGITVNRKAQKVFVNRPQWVFNPSDRNALEAALRLGGDIVVAAVGGAAAEQGLREARAMGARRALLLRDQALADADAFGLANALKAVVHHLGGVDLVLCGSQVLDADLAQVGPRLAQALDWPFAANAHAVQAADGEVALITSRRGEWRQAALTLPAVVAVAPDSNKPRLPAGQQIINVYTDPGAVETLTAADLGLSEAELQPLTEPRGQSFPAERELGRRLDGDIAGQLADILRKA